MALGTTNITTTLVGQTIGVASRDIGFLCTAAKSGGVLTNHSDPTDRYYSAFDIQEIGLNDGYLIDGATPYHNPFSNNAPSFLTLSGTTIKCKLKNLGYVASEGASFSLGDFRGYNHQASAPSFWVTSKFSASSNTNRFVAEIIKSDYNFLNIISLPAGYSLKFAINVESDATLICSEPISSGVSEYYCSGTISASIDRDYYCTLALIEIKGDGTPSGVAYNFQNMGEWFNPTKLIETVALPPESVPSYTRLLVDIPVDITAETSNFYSNSSQTLVSFGFKCLDYRSIPIGDRTKSVKISIYNVQTSTVVFPETTVDTITIAANNSGSYIIEADYNPENYRCSIIIE